MNAKPFPCPWCGNDPVMFEDPESNPMRDAMPITYTLGCVNGACPVRPSLCFVTSEEIAIERWNNQTSYHEELPVQIDGKLSDVIRVSPVASPESLEYKALLAPNAKQSLIGKNIKRVIIIPKKLVNIVTWPTIPTV